MTEVERGDLDRPINLNFSERSKYVMGSAALLVDSLYGATHLRPELLLLSLLTEESVSEHFESIGLPTETVADSIINIIKPSPKIELVEVLEEQDSGVKKVVQKVKPHLKSIRPVTQRMLTNGTRDALLRADILSKNKGRQVEPLDILSGLIQADHSYVHDILESVGYKITQGSD